MDPHPDPLVRGTDPRIRSGSIPKCHGSGRRFKFSWRFGAILLLYYCSIITNYWPFIGFQALCAWMLTNADRARTSAAPTRPAATLWAASPAPAFLPLWASRLPSPAQVGTIYCTQSATTGTQKTGRLCWCTGTFLQGCGSAFISSGSSIFGWIPIRIQGFNNQKLNKNYSWKFFFFDQKLQFTYP